jgi:peptidoglycan hydrolase CwlO-like protein
MKKKFFWIWLLIAMILLFRVGKEVFAEEKNNTFSLLKKPYSSRIDLFQKRENNLRQHLNSLNQLLQTKPGLPHP